MRILMFLILFSVSSCTTTAQSGNSSTSNNQTEITQNQEIIDANLCDVDQHPEKFEQKLIRVKAIYLYGFEWSTFYSTKCEIKKRIWVEHNTTRCEKSDKIDEMENAGMGGRTVGIIAIGQFRGGENERFGNMNNYNYLFKVNCFEKAVMLDDKNLLPDNPELKKKMEEFENSN